MAGKRGATTELSQDNWDEEDDVEVQGTFQKATNDILKKRIIKTAKRRNPIRVEGDEKKSAFASFTGFTNKPLGGDFSFLSDTSKSDSSPKTNGIDFKGSKEGGFFKGNSSNIFGAPTALGGSSNIFGSTANSANLINPIVPSSSTITNKSEKFCSKLKGLNESVSKWISMKVTENPLVSLQPIFKDYEKYLDEIEKEDNKEANSHKPDKQTIPIFNFTPSPAKNNIAIPDSTTEKSTDKESSTVPTFKFGIPTTTSSNVPKPTFSFGLTNNDSGTIKPNNDSTAIKPFPSLTTSNKSNPVPTFSFGSPKSNDLPPPASTGFSFSNIKNQQEEKSNQNQDNNEDDEENEPPKVEIRPVMEKDSLYTTRCKVFVKKGKEYSDRGIGNLFLKSIDNSEKVQLIVRAETSLGNLLLNFILSKNVPTQRMGKQNVMLVAVPTPDVKPPPVPLLIKVKSAEEADQLLEVLEKYKK